MKILNFISNWFQKNGFIKILIAFLVLIISVWLSPIYPHSISDWIGIIAACYLVLTIVVFFIAGIINIINDIINK
jgi:hypothetical protein